jgi:hypothetical protein
MSQLLTTSIVDFRKKNYPKINEAFCLLGNYFVLSKTCNYKELIPDYHQLKENAIVIFDELQNKSEVLKNLKLVFPTKTFTTLDAKSLISLFPEVAKQEEIVFSFLPTVHWSSVLKNLFIGDYLSSQDHEMINKMNIRAIINVAPDCCANKYEENPEFSYFTIYEMDNEKDTLRPYFHCTNRFIEKHSETNAVLVHCAAGVSRSSTIVIAYLMYKLQMEFEDALHFLKNCHPQAYPNRQFYCDLINFQNEIMPKRY